MLFHAIYIVTQTINLNDVSPTLQAWRKTFLQRNKELVSKTLLTETEWVSRRLRAARALSGESLEAFALGAGVDTKVISDAENGLYLPEPTEWYNILHYLAGKGVRPTDFGVEFDRDAIEPPERAKTLWATKPIRDPRFPD